MVKLANRVILFAAMTSLSWTVYRAAPAAATAGPQAAAVNPLSTEAAQRHRAGLPNHWRGYMLQQQPRF